MARSICTVISETGDVRVDLDGFAGGACVAEEERLLQALAALGIVLRPAAIARKPTSPPNTHRNPLSADG